MNSRNANIQADLTESTGIQTCPDIPVGEPYNVQRFDLGMEGIRAYSLNTRLTRPETEQSQARLARKWDAWSLELRRRPFLSPERTEQWQLERLSLLIDLAYYCIPFYRRLYNTVGFRPGDIVTMDDYNRLPTVSKADIVACPEDFRSSTIEQPAELYQNRTSGSSGKSITILRDDASVDVYTLQWLRHYEMMLGRPLGPTEWRYETYLVPPRFTSFGGSYRMFTISQDCDPRLVLDHLRLLRPTVLAGFPSYLRRLAESNTNLREFGVEVVCTNSEGSLKSHRDWMSKRFCVPVLDEYSSEEMQLIATECRCGSYHVVADNVRVDTIGEGDGDGEIIVTNLWNTYMPLIRYRHADRVRMADSGCKTCDYGVRWPCIELVVGRIDDELLSDSGPVASSGLMALYDRVLVDPTSNVGEFQFIQTDRGSVTVLLVPENREKPVKVSVEADLRNGLEALMRQSLNVTVLVLEEIPSVAGTKRKIVVNRMRRGGMVDEGRSYPRQ